MIEMITKRYGFFSDDDKIVMKPYSSPRQNIEPEPVNKDVELANYLEKSHVERKNMKDLQT